jgi:quinol---cytochrome c reductase cytochrome c subunit, bacillus type
MADQPTDEIFPQHTNKTYALVEVMPGETPLVGKGPDDTVFSFPIVLLWEIVLLLGVTFALFVFSLIKQAPLETIANPLVTTDPAKAPWYFMGLQELLEHMHPLVAGILIPTILVGFLIVLPYIDHSKAGAGAWFSSKRGKRIVGWTALYTAIIMPIYILLDNAFSLREMLRGVLPDWIAQGVLPALIIAVIVVLPVLILVRWKPTVREVMLALFTVMFVSAIVLTLSGFLFRGPGFKLYLPWQMPNGYNPFNGL